MSVSENQNTIFPGGDKAPADYFTGTVWIRMLVPNELTLNCQIANVVFEKGARNNWHTHPGGQILIVADGIGYYQEKGKPTQVIQKGDVINIPPCIEHWHGASHDTEVTHIAINPNMQKGIAVWLERVTDEEYNNFK